MKDLSMETIRTLHAATKTRDSYETLKRVSWVLDQLEKSQDKSVYDNVVNDLYFEELISVLLDAESALEELLPEEESDEFFTDEDFIDEVLR